MEEKEAQIVEERVKESALDQARKELKKDRRKKRLSKISSIVVPILIGIVVIGYPILMHNINADKKERYWKEMIGITEVRYSELKAEESESLYELNKKNNGRFYWLKEAQIIGTYQFKENNKIILIEEHYLFEGTECVLYVLNTESKIDKLVMNDSKLDKEYALDINKKLKYTVDESESYGKFNDIYIYQIEIQSTNMTIVETIFKNLTNR